MACPTEWLEAGSAACENGHVVQAQGYWRSEGPITNETRFFQCFVQNACLGSNSSDTGAPNFDSQCAAGHTGPVCALCMNGWAMHGRHCARCTSAPAATLAATASLISLGAVAVTLLAFRFRKRFGLTNKHVAPVRGHAMMGHVTHAPA